MLIETSSFVRDSSRIVILDICLEKFVYYMLLLYQSKPVADHDDGNLFS